MNRQARKLVLAAVAATVTTVSLNTIPATAREAVLFQPSAKLSPSSLNAYTSAGIKIGSYLGNGQYEASVEDGSLDQVSQRLSAIDGGAQIETMPTSIKLKPLLRGKPSVPTEIVDHDDRVSVTVLPAPGQDIDAFTGLLRQLDPKAQRNIKVGGWSLRIDKNELTRLAAKPQVASIRRAPAYPTLR